MACAKKFCGSRGEPFSYDGKFLGLGRIRKADSSRAVTRIRLRDRSRNGLKKGWKMPDIQQFPPFSTLILMLEGNEQEPPPLRMPKEEAHGKEVENDAKMVGRCGIL